MGAAALAATPIAGCAGGQGQPEVSGPLDEVTKDKVTLTWWVLPSPQEEAWSTALADDFQKIYPNITIDVQKSAQVGDVKSVIAAYIARKLPDLIFAADVTVTDESAKGLLMNLTPYMKAYGYQESDFLGNVMGLGQYKGDQYVLPRGLDQVVTAYNPALFDKFGVPVPTMGWTWDDFVAASKELTRKEGGTQYYALGNGATYTGYPIYVPFMRGWGGDIVNAEGTRSTMSDPKVVKGVSEMMGYFAKYTTAFSPPPADPFNAGQAAMNWYVRPSVFAGIVNAERNDWSIPFQPEFVNFPLFPTPKIGAGMAGIGATVNTEHPKEAAAFMMYTLSRRGTLTYSKAAGEVPIRTDLKDSQVWRDVLNFKGEVDQRAFIEYVEYHSYPPSNLPIASNAEVAQSISTAFDEIRLGRKAPDEALADADEQANHVMEDQQGR